MRPALEHVLGLRGLGVRDGYEVHVRVALGVARNERAEVGGSFRGADVDVVAQGDCLELPRLAREPAPVAEVGHEHAFQAGLSAVDQHGLPVARDPDLRKRLGRHGRVEGDLRRRLRLQ